jgi:hypothetical protein
MNMMMEKNLTRYNYGQRFVGLPSQKWILFMGTSDVHKESFFFYFDSRAMKILFVMTNN